MVKLKRCNFYDDDGGKRPRADGQLGCPNHACKFVHPDSRSWRDLPAVMPPPKYLLAKSEWDISPRKARRRSREPSVDSTHSDTYLHQKPVRRDSPYQRGRSRSRSHHRDSRSPSRSSRGYRDRRPSLDEPGPSRRASTSQKPPAHAKVSTVPLAKMSLPPETAPSLPDTPDFLSTILPAPNADQSDRAKQLLWKERFKLMSDGANLHTDCSNLTSEIAKMQRLTQTAHFPNLDDEEKSMITIHISELDMQRCRKSKDLESVIQALAKTDFWPILQPPLDMKAEVTRYETTQKLCLKLQDAVSTIKEDLNAIAAARQEQGMKAEQELLDDRRPRKRQRLEEGATGIFNEDYADELSDVQDRLVKLESDLSGLQNYLDQREADVTQAIDDAFEARWDEFGPPMVSQDAEDPSRITHLENEVTRTGLEVGELASEVAALMLKDTDLDKEIRFMEEQNAREHEAINLHNQEMNQLRENLETHQRKTEALNAAFKAHLAHTHTLHLPPVLPSQEFIMHALEEPIIDAIREQVTPALEQLAAEFEAVVTTKNLELYDTLWGKLELVRRMMDALALKVDKEQAEIP